MTVQTMNDLEQFRDHLNELIQAGTSVVSLESVVADWRRAYPDPEELAAPEEALVDQCLPFEEFDREFSRRHGLVLMKP